MEDYRDYDVVIFVDPPLSSSKARENHIMRTDMTPKEIVEFYRKKGKIVDSVIEIEWTKNSEIAITNKKEV